MRMGKSVYALSHYLPLTIRGLSLWQVSSFNLRWLGNKELVIGLLNGALWSVVVAIITFFWFHDVTLALIISAVCYQPGSCRSIRCTGSRHAGSYGY